MRPAEETVRSLVAQWVAKADEDLWLIERIAGEARGHPSLVAFHAQQAVEKYVKALLARHQIDFPKTHDIKSLLDLLSSVDPETASHLLEARWLTPFSAAIRYPGDFPDLRPGDEDEAIRTAQRTRAVVMGRLEGYLSGKS